MHVHAHVQTSALMLHGFEQVLQKIPFSLPFSLRVRVLRNLIHQDRALVHDSPHDWIRARVHRDSVLQGQLKVLVGFFHTLEVGASECLSLSVSRDRPNTDNRWRTDGAGDGAGGICRQTLVHRHAESLTHIHPLCFCLVFCLCLCAPNEVSLHPPLSLDPPLALLSLSPFSFARTYAQRLV
jgi:hypothetical protein